MIQDIRIIAKKMMMSDLKSIIKTIFVVDLILVIFSLFKGDMWLINSQIAFMSSLLITITSYYSYKRVIQKRLEANVDNVDDRDVVEKIDDPYDLYSEDDSSKKELDLKEVIKEERKKSISLKTTANNLSKTIGGAFSPIRLLSYLFLFVSFIYLVNNQKFYLIAYIVGLFVVPLSALLWSFFIKD